MPQKHVVKNQFTELKREAALAAILASALTEQGWRVVREAATAGPSRVDLLASKKRVKLAVELKTIAEGRADRLIPLWSQAWLQAQHLASAGQIPMAVVGADRIAPKSADVILKFIHQVAPEASAGVMDLSGLRRFVGPHAQGLNRAAKSPRRRSDASQAVRANLFSDLNQWMVKVLIAPDVGERYLSAPRARYHGASELGEAAGVSIMSASRLVRNLRRQGYLDESAPHLRLVRLRALLERWQAAVSSQPVIEQPWRSVLPGRPGSEMGRWLAQADGCIALFAAAQAHGLGLVEGVPDHVYARSSAAQAEADSGFVPAQPGEVPQFFVRVPSAPESVFRGKVNVHGRPVCDVLQVWLDVAAHPSRGQEQADFIWRKVLEPLCKREGR